MVYRLARDQVKLKGQVRRGWEQGSCCIRSAVQCSAVQCSVSRSVQCVCLPDSVTGVLQVLIPAALTREEEAAPIRAKVGGQRH